MSNKHTTISGVLGRRRVIPRWKAPSLSVSANEQKPFKPPSEKRLQNWSNWRARLKHKQHEHPMAEELISEYREIDFLITDAPIADSPVVSGGSDRLIKSDLEPREAQNDLRKAGVEISQFIDRDKGMIHRIKQSLNSNPNSPLLWAELGRIYLSFGLDKKSEKAMLCAMQLAPHNRYLSRSAARMYVHVDKIDGALRVLRANAKLPNDPWLLAADIAISTITEKTSRFHRRAEILIESKKFDDIHLSELRSAIATVEAVNGKHKKAKKLFEDSLLSATENSIAQAQWASDENMLSQFHPESLSFDGAFEAQARWARSEERWDDMLSAAEAWLDEEPYSSHPAAIGSYPCFSPEQIARAISIATRGIYSSPNNILLRNNRAVSYIYDGKYTAAIEDLWAGLHAPDAKNSFHLLASAGLLFYRMGDQKTAHLCYKEAVGKFVECKDMASAVLALLFFIKEEVRSGRESSAAGLADLRAISKRLNFSNQPEVSSMFKHIDALRSANYSESMNLNRLLSIDSTFKLKSRVGKVFNIDLDAQPDVDNFWHAIQSSGV